MDNIETALPADDIKKIAYDLIDTISYDQDLSSGQIADIKSGVLLFLCRLMEDLQEWEEKADETHSIYYEKEITEAEEVE